MIYVRPQGFLKLGSLIREIGRKDAKAACARAISRTATTMGKQTAIAIRQRRLVKMSAGDVKRSITVRMKVKGEIDQMFASVMMSPRSISLSKFWAKRAAPPKGMKRLSAIGNKDQKLKAVKVTVLGRTSYAGKGRAFLVDRGTSGLIFMRTGKARTPLKKLWGPSISDLVRKSGLIPTLTEDAGKRFEQVLAQEVAYRIAKRKAAKG